jgi:hypothetical protein
VFLATVKRDISRTLSGGNNIQGLAIMNNELYVGRDYQSVIEVYDVTTINRRRNLSISGLRSVADMTSCRQCDAVYISDWRAKKIIIINSHGVVVSSWSVVGIPRSLSVNPQLNVAIVVVVSGPLQVYTQQGEFVRNISLQSDIEEVQQALQLDVDRYVVVHSSILDESLHGVCIVNSSGTIIQSYGGNQGSGIGQLNGPHRMLIFGGSLILADYENFRVLLFNVSSLTYERELISTHDTRLLPNRFAISDDGTQLFVSYYQQEIRTFNVLWV